jgi:hypothetical protein
MWSLVRDADIHTHKLTRAVATARHTREGHRERATITLTSSWIGSILLIQWNFSLALMYNLLYE